MRLLVRDIDDFYVTPADLSETDFEGSPGRLAVSRGRCELEVLPSRSATHHRPSGSVGPDEWFDLADELRPPCDATVRWDGGVAFLHVVSYHYCTLDDVLDVGDDQRKSPRDLERTEEDAFRARSVAEAVADDLMGRTFRATHRTDRAEWGRSNLRQLMWPASMLLTPGWELEGDGLARRVAPACRPWAGPHDSIEYVSGRDEGVPPDVRRAVAKLAASYLVASKVPDRAVYESTGDGMTRWTLADSESTGIPDVDAIFARHRRTRLVVM